MASMGVSDSCVCLAGNGAAVPGGVDLRALALRGVQLDLALKFVLFASLFVGVTFLLACGIKQLPVASSIE